MVTIHFDENQLRARISILPRFSAITFAAACAARLENTARHLNVSDGLMVLLSRNIEAVITYLEGGLMFDTLAAQKELLAAMPDEDASPDLLGAIAEDAAAATVYAVRSIQEGDPRNAVWAAQRAYEAADREVLGTLDVGTVGDSEEVYILEHPFIQTELRRQSRDLDAVSEVTDDTLPDLIGIVARARSENIFRH